MKMDIKRFFIIICGPTGVGKTNLVDRLCQYSDFNIEIVNADMAQAYTKLSIGTAKPDLNSIQVPHHWFDVLAVPQAYNIAAYRRDIIALMENIWRREAIPVVVGGSGFYIKSLFFSHQNLQEQHIFDYKKYSCQELWNMLQDIDQKRANEIHPHDRYRIERALNIWNTGAIKPSECEPKFEPIGQAYILFLTRERNELYELINKRIDTMFNQGWIEEVKNLPVSWKIFVQEKKIIGYPDIIDYLEGKLTKADLIDNIEKKTRSYAKRQVTFWRSFKNCLQKSNKSKEYIKNIQEANLTFLNLDLYIDQLSKEIYSMLYN